MDRNSQIYPDGTPNLKAIRVYYAFIEALQRIWSDLGFAADLIWFKLGLIRWIAEHHTEADSMEADLIC